MHNYIENFNKEYLKTENLQFNQSSYEPQNAPLWELQCEGYVTPITNSLVSDNWFIQATNCLRIVSCLNKQIATYICKNNLFPFLDATNDGQGQHWKVLKW